ncbi:MAG: acetyl-CoA carboxylase carboxyltransferase subunit alpha [Nitrospirota bacterium]|jgi:acetyl-CoA carboxylase carboxyl transferase subunit alpha
MTIDYLDFEKPVAEINKRIEELRRLSDGKSIEEIQRLEQKAEGLMVEIYSHLTPWQKTLTARHPSRPYTTDYVDFLMEDFIEIHGDRFFGDDPSIMAGLARLDRIPVIVIGHQKGRGTRERIYRNFGQPHPEGNRKALRVMKLAEKFQKPVITFVDTPGAYPGIGAEERGQGEAIARNLKEMVTIRMPIIVVVIGEGGSGGALALGVGDRILMLEHSVYSVISPEGCAAILWKKDGQSVDQDEIDRAAEALKLTAQELFNLGIVDEIIKEPLGGAHRNPNETAETLGEAIKRNLRGLFQMPIDELINRRYEKFRRIGTFEEGTEG